MTSRKPLRVWPGVAIVIVQWLVWLVVPVVVPDAGLIGVLGGVAGGLAVAVWWLLFSRAPWVERVGGIILMVGAVMATKLFVHESIAGAGMGNFFYIFSIPYLSLALVAWAWATRHLADGTRRAALVGAILLACAPWTLLRTAGVGGSGSEFHLRWTPTPEERLLAQANDEPKPLPPAAAPAAMPTAPLTVPTTDKAAGDKAAAGNATAVEADGGKAEDGNAPDGKPAAALTAGGAAAPAPATIDSAAPAPKEARPAEWPGFRGPARDGIIRGVRIVTDWTASPPVEMWRRPVGPGWSSFAVRGDLLYTQEQRGEDEIVACYRVSTGEPVWRHRDPVRFWESNGGAGPRATPTVHDGRVYTFGATGILNALDDASGAVVWSRNAASDADRKLPGWGFTSSPLIVDDLVIVAASGTLAAFDRTTGVPRWVGRRLLGSYSSPHLATIDGVRQVLLLSGSGAVGVAPANGAVLWEHKWQESGAPIVQPALTADGDILINALAMTGGAGLRRLAVAQQSGGWRVDERWTSNGLKPNFNDFVVHKGHAFGFDGTILASIDLRDGTRKWKGGRYGNGQLVLLADQDLLLVVSEEGELVLVKATPDQFTEIARFPALEGKTWNHPVLVGNVLLVRNGEEMAAFRLSLAGS